ncbi:hypothetical protein KUTeg_001263 [Tegillarca granosa]|uniref:Uncharacterized protein n=1 Tax=Tegillarca granosa TaxID=220873 RepID=A0ABQ9FV48_TEGGR|nr:hypothetical protein KUTeg_001263 [Tegillarca granosa]
MWLNAYYTNSDPKVIGGYFLETIQSLGGCPIIVRGDKGTENSHVCTFSVSFVAMGTTIFLAIKVLCTAAVQAAGHFDGGFLDKNLVLFSFLSLIQTDLDETAKVWDSHLIRRSRNTNVPTGRPNIMYSIPELYSTDNYLCEIDDEEIEICKEHATFRSGLHCDEDIYNMCIQIIAENSLLIPKDPYQALDLYLELRQKIISLLP